MPNINDSAVQSDSSRTVVFIQLTVVKPGEHKRLCIISFCDSRNHLLYQSTGDASVPIWKMVDIRVVFIVFSNRFEPKRSTTFRRSNRHQFCWCATPINTTVSGHSQHARVVNAQRVLKVVKICVCLYVTVYFIGRHRQQV